MSGRTSDERGFVLVVALIAMVMLTGLGVATVNSASIDLQAAHNMRKMEMAFYASQAGLEHGRYEVYSYTLRMENPDGLTFSASEPMHTADGAYLGSYDVEVVYGDCGGPPPGYSMDLYYSFYYDIRSTGRLIDGAGLELSPATSVSQMRVMAPKLALCDKTPNW